MITSIFVKGLYDHLMEKAVILLRPRSTYAPELVVNEFPQRIYAGQ